jgi:2-isopropylmalate synthase
MVEILDTTLREGEQTPGVTFRTEERLKIACLLDDFGVNIIEAGHPRVSSDIYYGLKQITRQGLNAEILAHCRAKQEDIDIARSCDVDWIGIFFCVEKDRLKHYFKIEVDEAIRIITNSVEYAKSHGLKVRYTLEDATRTDYTTMIKVAKKVILAGADRISIADTVGVMIPIKMYNLISKLKSDLGVKLNIHCHNDLGLATANSLAAFEGGASTIDVTINGLGERAGIASLSEICLILNCLYNIKNNWKLELIPEISSYVEKISELNISPNTPIIGKNAFIHNAGLHVSAILKDPRFYEAFPAELIGKKRDFVLDKMSGKETIQYKLKEMNLEICNADVTNVLNYAKSKEKGYVSGNDIINLLNDNLFDTIDYQ